MKEVSHLDKLPYRNVLAIALSLVAAVAVLMYFLPRESKFGFEYEENRPWRYPQLIAEYYFPIFKTEEEMRHERDSLLRTFRPYFRVDSQMVEQKVMELKNDFHASAANGVPYYYLPRLVELLREVYAQGIISSEYVDKFRRSGRKHLLIINGNVATERELDDVYTLATSYEHILEKEADGFGNNMLERSQIRKYLAPNIVYDKERTDAEREELLRLSPTCGMVQAGQLIIDRGQIVTAGHVKVLNSLKRESERRLDPKNGFWWIFLGQLVFLCTLLGLFLYYVRLYRRDYMYSLRSILLLILLVTVFPILTYVMMSNHLLSVYLLPYAIVPIFVRIFFDSRTAFLASVVSTLLSSMVLYGPYEFLLLQLVAGMTAIYTLREMTERSQVLKTAFAVTLTGMVVVAAYDLSQGMSWEMFNDSRVVYVAISGVCLLFCYPLMYVVERLFGFTSSVTLVELTNINNAILRKMSKVAQGTFNHSMQVANLAAEVADQIGAKPQLVRTGAMYHDIGKILNPAFFTENQSGVNPHDSLSEERSAAIIISHVTDGLRLAEKYHLPPVIRGFIATHHGTGMAKYFYIQYCNKHPGETVDPALFTYPGPMPSTREQAILMMCDSVEAASRSLSEYTEESISELVNRIIDGQLADGCFKECPLTFRDVAVAKRVLIESLKTVYHTRIPYPELKKKTEEKAQPARQGFFSTNRYRNRDK